MKNLQEIFTNIQELKKEQKGIRKEYKDELAADKEYEKVLEEIKELKIKKEQYELSAQNNLGSRYERLDDLKHEIKEQDEMLSDIAINTLMEGKTVEVKDQYDNEFTPIWKVSFRKVQ